jgi:hypothetical protein
MLFALHFVGWDTQRKTLGSKAGQISRSVSWFDWRRTKVMMSGPSLPGSHKKPSCARTIKKKKNKQTKIKIKKKKINKKKNLGFT